MEHKNLGKDIHCFRPTQESLYEYMKIVNELTIDEEKTLRRIIDVQKIIYDKYIKEIVQIKRQMVN